MGIEEAVVSPAEDDVYMLCFFINVVLGSINELRVQIVGGCTRISVFQLQFCCCEGMNSLGISGSGRHVGHERSLHMEYS